MDVILSTWGVGASFPAGRIGQVLGDRQGAVAVQRQAQEGDRGF